MKREHCLPESQCRTFRNLFSRGFSLIELLVAVTVFAIVIGASYSTYISFIQSTVQQSAQTAVNAGLTTTLKLLERDIEMAGFGLPQSTRVASDPNCNVGDETFCKSNTDRIFVADGWEILRDFTDNQEVDGRVPTPPSSAVDYLSRVSNGKSGGGYRALLQSAASTGASSVSVTTVNIDSLANSTALFPGNDYSERADPDPGGCDIKKGTAFIMSDTNTGFVEGHRINPDSDPNVVYSCSSTAISARANDSLHKNYSIATSAVVPAIAWYVRADPDGATFPDGSKVYWLYRNESRVIPNVDSLQVWYGYDAYPNDQVKGGIQSGAWSQPMPQTTWQNVDWNRQIPPTVSSGGAAANPDGISAATTFDFKWLKAIRIVLAVKAVDQKDRTKVTISYFTATVDLKN